MNSAALKSNPANSNSNPGLLSTVTVNADKSVTYRNIQDRASKRYGVAREGQVRVGHHAHVEPGKRIVIWGVHRNRWVMRDGARVAGIVPYRHELTIGDRVVTGGLNLTYTGEIVSIGPKTVTVKDEFSRTHQFSIYRFSTLNDDLDLEEIARRNSEWND